MRLLRNMLSVLRTRWFWSLIGAAILSVLIWFYGDLVGIGDTHPLAPPVHRLVVILGIAIVWGMWNVLAMAASRRRNDQLVAALAEPSRDHAPASAELAELNKRFTAALEELKRTRLGKKGNRRWLYELPWFVMIGPPGSGKSTALAQSGLRLRNGQIQELRGTAGTRSCDWVFTDEAVLIDTAGRYTSQDSDPGADQAAWLGFLDLLKERRPRYPLNGILVALPTRDLVQDGAVDHASMIRARLEEIEKRLGMRLPVYLLVTKADLIAGFEPFFDSLNESEREQVWGYTFDYTPQPRGRPPMFDADSLQTGWGDLVARLDYRVPARLAAESDVRRRAQIFAFPAQIAALGDEVLRFVQRCFQPSSYERGGWLRGVYLTSGTQTGTPIDRLMATIAQSIGAKISPPSIEGGDRSFFLRNLLEGVIFPEADIAGRDMIRNRRETRLRQAAIAGVAAVVILATAAWAWSFAGNNDRYAAIEKRLSEWSQESRALSNTRLTNTDADVLAVIPLLDRLDNLRESVRREDSTDLHLGLSQFSTVESELNSAYHTALVRLLLPRLFLATERNLRARLQDADFLAIGLKVYLSLAGSAPVDPALLQQWFSLTLQSRSREMSAAIERHVGALVATLPEVDTKARPVPDPPLLAKAQASFARLPLAKRAYTTLISSAAVTALPGWKLTEHAGPNASTALVRRSGRPLDYPVPAILTYDGFHQVFQPQLDAVARGSYAEYWVLTGRSTPEASDADIRKLKTDMLRLYYDDVIAAWDGLLRDITIVPINTLDQAVEATKALSGPSSPLKLLIQAVVRETSLTVPPEPAQADPKNPAAIALKAAGKVNASLDNLARLIRPAAAATAPAELPGAPVEAHFAYLRRLVQGENGAPPALDEALSALGTLNAKLAEAAASPNPGEAFARMGNTATAQLALATRSLPDPLKQMLDGVQRKATDIGKTGAHQQVNAVWTTEVLPFCQTAVADRYPFSPSSQADATIEDVTRVFGPSGLIESFIKAQLANFVDTSRRPWKDSQNIGLSAASLESLARAHRISGALFPAGAGPKAAFSVVPLSLDSDAASVVLNVDGQELRYSHGPPQPTAFTWPGPAGTNTVRLSFVPFGGGAPTTTTMEGPWALFRLLRQKNFQSTAQPDVFEAEIAAGSHSMRVKIRASSVENPFDPRLLSGFACPEGL